MLGAARLLDCCCDLYRDDEHLKQFNVLIGDGDNSLTRAMNPHEQPDIVCHRFPVNVFLFDFEMLNYGSPVGFREYNDKCSILYTRYNL